MAKLLGTEAVLKVGGTALLNVKSVTFGNTRTAVDSTDNDDAGVKTYLGGDEDGSCSCSFHYDPSGAQTTLITNFQAGTETAFIYYPQGDTGGLYRYTFNGVITALNFPAAHETTLEGSVDIQITGGVAAATS